MNSDTPRTDSMAMQCDHSPDCYEVDADFARQLEREANQWRECAEALAACLSLHAKFYRFNPDDNTALAGFKELSE